MTADALNALVLRAREEWAPSEADDNEFQISVILAAADILSRYLAAPPREQVGILEEFERL